MSWSWWWPVWWIYFIGVGICTHRFRDYPHIRARQIGLPITLVAMLTTVGIMLWPLASLFGMFLLYLTPNKDS